MLTSIIEQGLLERSKELLSFQDQVFLENPKGPKRAQKNHWLYEAHGADFGKVQHYAARRSGVCRNPREAGIAKIQIFTGEELDDWVVPELQGFSRANDRWTHRSRRP